MSGCRGIPRCPHASSAAASETEMAVSSQKVSRYAFHRAAGGSDLEALLAELARALERHGFAHAQDDAPPDLVLNAIDRERPRPFRRRSRGTFVAAIHVRRDAPADPLREGYPLLVRALANLALCYV